LEKQQAKYDEIYGEDSVSSLEDNIKVREPEEKKPLEPHFWYLDVKGGQLRFLSRSISVCCVILLLLL
jgi:hypothetical protein